MGPLHTVPQTAFPTPRQEDCRPPAPPAQYDHVQFRTLLLSGGNDLARFSYHRYKNDAVLVSHEQDCFYQWAVLSDGSGPWQI